MRYRVLHIIYSLFRGGAERLIETTVRFSDPSLFQHSVCSLTEAGDMASSIERAGAEVHVMGKRGRFDLRVFLRLASLIRKGGFDLLHLHNMPGNLWGTAASSAALSSTPIVRTEHGYLFHSRYPRFYEYLYVVLSARSRKIICVCDALRETLSDRFPSLKEKLITIRNGIPAEDFSGLPSKEECRRFFDLPSGPGLIGTAGRLSGEKNQAELIRAFRMVSEDLTGVNLAIMGEGEMKDDLTSAAEDMGLAGRIIFLPPSGEIDRFYGALDLFVLSSTSEGMPLTLLEAMACGLPVVAPAVGGIPEAAEDSLSGYLYPAGNEELLADRISGIISDPGMGKRMGERGREIVRREFNAGRFASEQDELYMRIIRESARPGRPL
ncbi:MAG: glycosyltransferase [Candidatus Krumholzibacteriales bacterium]